jgi:hypothetical protein
MARPCTVCQHPRLSEISTDMAGGVSDVQIAKRYSLSRAAVQRHRTHVGAPNAFAAAERKGMAFTALAALPSIEEVGQAYASIASRIDAISAKAEEEKSLAVALMGLRELRSTVTAQAHLAGHLGAGANVQVNTQVNVDLGQAVKELIAAIKPSPDPVIPAELAAHFDGAAKPDPQALARLEAIIDAN